MAVGPARGSRRALAGFLVAMVALIGCGVADAPEAPGFEPVPVSVPEFKIFDIGAVDFDGDGDLDIYTNNHLGRSGLLENDGSGAFDDVMTERGLDHTPAFPGWEVGPHRPDTSDPGLYVYRIRGRIKIEQVAAGPSPVRGTIAFATGVKVDSSGPVDVEVTRDRAGRFRGSTVAFSSQGSFEIKLNPDRATLPVEVTVAEPFPLSEVFVGEDRINPTARAFSVLVNDRHGAVWADLDGDAMTDALITRGGVSGDISKFGGLVQDELMINDGSRFGNAQQGSGLRKGSCRTRGAAAVDVDRDGRLDLFVTCSGSDAPHLYLQRARGGFRDDSRPLRDARVKGTRFEWLDLDGDRALELLIAKQNNFIVYRRANGDWVRDQRIALRRPAKVETLTAGDFDRDGDPDVFAAGAEGAGNTLLVNRRGRLRGQSPRRVGLPGGHSVTASWVDYDNDGRLDLHVLPQGLYRQKQAARGARFRRTGEVKTARGIVNAVAEWFDRDGDGDRDALLAVRPEREPEWPTRLLENRGRSNRWLAVDLSDRPGNLEAVGAKVSVTSDGGTQTQWVGQSAGSRFSQGHYRLYFGLGDDDRVERVVVEWPLGGTTRLTDVESDQLLRIER